MIVVLMTAVKRPFRLHGKFLEIFLAVEVGFVQTHEVDFMWEYVHT